MFNANVSASPPPHRRLRARSQGNTMAALNCPHSPEHNTIPIALPLPPPPPPPPPPSFPTQLRARKQQLLKRWKQEDTLDAAAQQLSDLA